MQGPPIQPGFVEYPRDGGGGPLGPAPQVVRFEAIGDAWRLATRDWLIWVCTSLISYGISVAVSIPYMILVFSRMDLANPRQNQNFMLSTNAIVLTTIVACISSVVFGIFNAGLMHGALKKIRTGYLTFSDIFDFNGRLGAVAAASLILAPLAILPVFAGMWTRDLFIGDSNPFAAQMGSAVGQLGSYIPLGFLYAVCSFVPLLIIDRRMSVGEAYRTSLTTLGKHIFPMVGVLIVVSILSGLGICALCVGILFTMPLVYICRAVVYNDFFRPVSAPPPPQTYGVSYGNNPNPSNMGGPPTL